MFLNSSSVASGRLCLVIVVFTKYLHFYEPVHNKTYNKTGSTSKDSDQSVHPHSMARVFVYISLDSPECVEWTCDQRRLIRLHRNAV